MSNFYEILERVEDNYSLEYDSAVKEYEEKVDIDKGTIAAIAVSVSAIGLLVAKIVKESKITKTIKNTEELASIHKKIKSTNKDIHAKWAALCNKRSKLDKLRSEYADLEEYYKSMRLSTSSSTSVSGNIGDNDASFSSTKTKENLNPNFDPEKARKYKSMKEEITNLEYEINSDLGKLGKLNSELVSYSRDLRMLAKKYKSENKDLAEKLESEVDKLSEVCKETMNEINNKNYWLIKESSDSVSELDAKLSVYESWYAGEITEEERNELLNMM